MARLGTKVGCTHDRAVEVIEALSSSSLGKAECFRIVDLVCRGKTPAVEQRFLRRTCLVGYRLGYELTIRTAYLDLIARRLSARAEKLSKWI